MTSPEAVLTQPVIDEYVSGVAWIEGDFSRP